MPIDLNQFRDDALAAIKQQPGLTRMQWFKATTDNAMLWHTFKFNVALVLVLGGHVKADGDNFFHTSHTK